MKKARKMFSAKINYKNDHTLWEKCSLYQNAR